jgi:sulfur carrier protein
MPEVNFITIQFNGKEAVFSPNAKIAEAILFSGVTSKSIAVELNGEIIEKSLYSSTFLKNGDVLEIVQPLGGGNR